MSDDDNNILIVDAGTTQRVGTAVAKWRTFAPASHIVVLTDSPHWTEARAAFAAGATDYLPRQTVTEREQMTDKPKILLVENIPTFRATVREYLEQQDYLVLEAATAAAARRLIEQETPALIIVDIRLVDDTDEKDVSGLTLVKQLSSAIPKIILTAFPTYQAVRESLAPSLLDGLPPTVGFIAKQEGLHKLLAAVQLALTPIHPNFKNQLLRAFQAPELWALPERVQELGVNEALERIQAATAATAAELTKLRKEARASARQQQRLSLVARLVGMALLVGAIWLLLQGATTPGVVSLIAGLMTNFINHLFARQEAMANQRVLELYGQLREFDRHQQMLLLSGALENPQEREAYKKKVLDQLLYHPAPGLIERN